MPQCRAQRCGLGFSKWADKAGGLAKHAKVGCCEAVALSAATPWLAWASWR